jgi:hypothetical protein
MTLLVTWGCHALPRPIRVAPLWGRQRQPHGVDRRAAGSACQARPVGRPGPALLSSRQSIRPAAHILGPVIPRLALLLLLVVGATALSACGGGSSSSSSSTSAPATSTAGSGGDVKAAKQACLDGAKNIPDPGARSTAEQACNRITFGETSNANVSAALHKAKQACLDGAKNIPIASVKQEVEQQCDKVAAR